MANSSMNRLRQILVTMALISFVSLAGFGLLITAERLEHASHHTTTAPCPFMPGEVVACLMGLQDHIAAWQNLLVMSSVTKVVLWLGLVIGWWWINQILVTRRRLPPTQARPYFWGRQLFVTTVQPRAP